MDMRVSGHEHGGEGEVDVVRGWGVAVIRISDFIINRLPTSAE